jgi:hypothetical protein
LTKTSLFLNESLFSDWMLFHIIARV